MAKITVKEITKKQVWEDFVLSYPGSNFLQSWNWGQFHQDLGKNAKRVGFYKGEKLVGVMLCLLEQAKRATYLTIPGGPLLDWKDSTVVNAFKQTSEDTANKLRCSFIRVRPQILETEVNDKLFASLGFKKAPMHLHAELTRQIDLSKAEDAILSEMRKTTRYEIKKAMGLGIKITISKNPEDIDQFYRLQLETAKRQEFVPFDKNFLKEQFKVFVINNQVALYTAWFGKKKLAQAFVIFYGGEADYHYGASTNEGRKYPGAYLIQWKAIKEAKRRGLKRYNLWGVAPEGQTNHRFYGVSVFKRGFGGEDLEYLHARDLIVNPVAYKLNWIVETARRKIRKV